MNESNSRPVILLVDDNPHDVVLIRLAFRKVGIIDTIQLVKDGTEAMRYIKGEKQYADRHQFPAPTLVLLDLKMPQTSGFDVLRWIREQPELAKIVIVVMSGSKNDNDISRAYSLGANAYLVKPTKFEDLVKMMESLKDYGTWQGKTGQKANSHSQARTTTAAEQWDSTSMVAGMAPV
ncbi:MAG: response regulator [Verrucomicrobiales bacterium]